MKAKNKIIFSGNTAIGTPQIPSQEVFDRAFDRNPTWAKVIMKAFDQITNVHSILYYISKKCWVKWFSCQTFSSNKRGQAANVFYLWRIRG